MAFGAGFVTRYFSPAVPPEVAGRRIGVWAHAAAVLIFAAAVAVAAVSRHVPADHADVLMSLQLARGGDDVVARTPADLRDAVLRALRDDARWLIPSYWALFTAVGVVLALGGGRIPRVWGWIVIAAITVAALCDLRENSLIAAALQESSAAAPAPWALAKWRLLFVVVGIVSVPFLPRSRRVSPHASLTAMLLLAAAILGFVATLGLTDGFAAATRLLAGALFLLALLFLWDPTYCARR